MPALAAGPLWTDISLLGVPHGGGPGRVLREVHYQVWLAWWALRSRRGRPRATSLRATGRSLGPCVVETGWSRSSSYRDWSTRPCGSWNVRRRVPDVPSGIDRHVGEVVVQVGRRRRLAEGTADRSRCCRCRTTPRGCACCGCPTSSTAPRRLVGEDPACRVRKIAVIDDQVAEPLLEPCSRSRGSPSDLQVELAAIVGAQDIDVVGDVVEVSSEVLAPNAAIHSGRRPGAPPAPGSVRRRAVVCRGRDVDQREVEARYIKVVVPLRVRRWRSPCRCHRRGPVPLTVLGCPLYSSEHPEPPAPPSAPQPVPEPPPLPTPSRSLGTRCWA